MTKAYHRGQLPRDNYGNVAPGAQSDGRGSLYGKMVVVTCGDDLPLGTTGECVWHGESEPYAWRVIVSVDDGLALIETAAVCVQEEAEAPAQVLEECPF